MIFPLLVVLVASFALDASSSPTNYRVIVERDADNLDCAHGAFRNSEGKIACAKGPGERCGGKLNIYGKCGDGLKCDECGLCRGCSINALRYGKVVCDPRKCKAGVETYFPTHPSQLENNVIRV